MNILRRIVERIRSHAAVVIDSPKFGILNLKGDTATSIITEDARAVGPVFGQAEISTNTVPRCNVLFLYCDVEPGGRIRNSAAGLWEIIRDSGALVVVVASENEVQAYITAVKQKGSGKANLVLTLQRKGRVFPTFFSRLFAAMKTGVPMPLAWVNLAPQIPGHEHPDCPGAILICKAGQVAFK